MSARAARLLQLLDRLRRARMAVTGEALAEEFGISLRSLYRDIAELRRQGAAIDGDPGVGYRLRAGFLLPPLMFSRDELEALVLGARWVQSQADGELASAAERALARISSALPEPLRLDIDNSSLFVPSWRQNTVEEPWLALLRHAIRDERKLCMNYIDAKGEPSSRIVWPFAMAFFDPLTRLFAAWCELRGDFRHFRADRVLALHDAGMRYPERRHTLIRRWRQLDGTRTEKTWPPCS
ncbi:MAG: YafY family protein [Pseudomonadota bacterium]|nr:YafY family protein [Pseudomonadota bacterium]